jgi:hypothetical protein
VEERKTDSLHIVLFMIKVWCWMQMAKWVKFWHVTIWHKVSRVLPRPLVYWCGIRLWHHATSGKWSGDDLTTMTMDTALGRWHRDNGDHPNAG